MITGVLIRKDSSYIFSNAFLFLIILAKFCTYARLIWSNFRLYHFKVVLTCRYELERAWRVHGAHDVGGPAEDEAEVAVVGRLIAQQRVSLVGRVLVTRDLEERNEFLTFWARSSMALSLAEEPIRKQCFPTKETPPLMSCSRQWSKFSKMRKCVTLV